MTAVRAAVTKCGGLLPALTTGACLLAAGAAGAAELNVQLTDAANGAVRDAVVYAEPLVARKSGAVPKNAVIDQIKKEFVPRVSVMQTGAAVSFPNKDDIRHQVYSFSPAKTFQLKLYHGVPSQPVVFDKPGTVVLGCNIHDNMVAYVLVVDTPHFARTDDKGRAHLEGLAPGEYEIKAWRPLSNGLSSVAAQRVKIAPEGGPAVALQLELKPAPVAAK